MLPSHKSHHRSDTIAIVRDCVEIIAIIAAGIWAFYIFIYESRIVPGQSQPALTFSATLEKTSEHNGLIAVHFESHIRNLGAMRVHFLGIDTSVVGQRVEPAATPQSRTLTNVEVLKQTFYRESQPATPVYDFGFITDLGNPTSGKDLFVDPGGDLELQDATIYVPSGKFDELKVWDVAGYLRDPVKVPTHFTVGHNGLPDLKFDSDSNDVYEIRATVGTLDLHAPIAAKL